MTVGERIKKRRKELEMSVDELASKLKKNRATVYRYESDEIENLSINLLVPISEALKCSPAYLMGWDDDEPDNLEIIVKENPEKYLESNPQAKRIIKVMAAHSDIKLDDNALQEIESFIEYKYSRLKNIKDAE